MKKLLSAAIATATLSMGVAAPAMAEVPGLSANVGFLSDYYFRGNHLGESSPDVGLDYEIAGFYVGTWAVDDGRTSCFDSDGDDQFDNCSAGNDGLEVDYYFGYGMEHGDFGWSVGYTGYEYTYTEDSESEINLGLSYAGFSLNYNIGVDNNISDLADDDNDHDYHFFTLGWSGDIFGVTYGNYKVTDLNDDYVDLVGKDVANANDVSKGDGYQYLELSAGGEVGGFDLGATIGRKFDIDSEVNGDKNGNLASDGGEYIFVDISKSFSF